MEIYFINLTLLCGAIVPKGTSIVGLDLRKTKIRPLHVPNPDVDDSIIPRSSLFSNCDATWQFSMFDNRSVYYSKTFRKKSKHISSQTNLF